MSCCSKSLWADILSGSFCHHWRSRFYRGCDCQNYCRKGGLSNRESARYKLEDARENCALMIHLAQIFDILSPKDGEKKIKELPNSERYVYQQTDIADRAKMEQAIQEALKKVPKGSLAGGVHCAAINPGMPWGPKMADKLDVRLLYCLSVDSQLTLEKRTLKRS